MKRLIVSCDGTWNNPSNDTNVDFVHQATNLQKRAAGQVEQIGHYQLGVGNEAGIRKLSGGGLGHGLTQDVKDCYNFLVREYEHNDEIYIFGYSRGAFTARSLVGLIRNVGLLYKDKEECADTAIELYRRRDAGPNSQIAIDFRKSNSRLVPIKFIGVWDTVGSMGVPVKPISPERWWRRKYGFHDVTLSKIVENAYHALAIDEKRGLFRPTLWEAKKSADTTGKPDQMSAKERKFREKYAYCFDGSVSVHRDDERDAIVDTSKLNLADQNVQQVWFRGCHSDVGGGSKPAGLSNITFKWIQEKAEGVGLEFEVDRITSPRFADSEEKIHKSRKGIYRPLPAHNRKLGVHWPEREYIHRTVVDHVAKNPHDYYPNNVGRYFALHEHYKEEPPQAPSTPDATVIAVDLKQNPFISEFEVAAGSTYDISVRGVGEDWWVHTDPTGRPINDNRFVRWIARGSQKFNKAVASVFRRRVRRYPMFALLGQVVATESDHQSELFEIGFGLNGWSSPMDGKLALLVNDFGDMGNWYRNNGGVFEVRITG